MWFPIPAIWIAQGMSATAAGADRLGGHLVEEATRAQVDGAEDRPPPAGDLPDASTQRALAEGGSAKPLPQPADRPGLRPVQQPQDALVQAGAAQRWPASSGPVAQPAGAVGVVAVDPRRTVPGSQPNSSAMAAADRPWWDSRIMTRRKAVRCGPWSRLSRSQGQAAGQEGLAYTLGDAYSRRPRRVGCAVEGFSDPRGYFTWWDLTAVTSRTSDHPLRLFVQPWLGGWCCAVGVHDRARACHRDAAGRRGSRFRPFSAAGR